MGIIIKGIRIKDCYQILRILVYTTEERFATRYQFIQLLRNRTYGTYKITIVDSTRDWVYRPQKQPLQHNKPLTNSTNTKNFSHVMTFFAFTLLGVFFSQYSILLSDEYLIILGSLYSSYQSILWFTVLSLFAMTSLILLTIKFSYFILKTNYEGGNYSPNGLQTNYLMKVFTVIFMIFILFLQPISASNNTNLLPPDSGDGWILYDADFSFGWEDSSFITITTDTDGSRKLITTNYISRSFDLTSFNWDGISQLELRVEVEPGDLADISLTTNGKELVSFDNIAGVAGLQNFDIRDEARILQLQAQSSLEIGLSAGSKIKQIGLWSDRPNYFSTNNPSAFQINFAAPAGVILDGFKANTPSSGIHRYSVFVPILSPRYPKTWSLFLNSFTSLPTASISPASSLPGVLILGFLKPNNILVGIQNMKGIVNLRGVIFLKFRTIISPKFTVAHIFLSVLHCPSETVFQPLGAEVHLVIRILFIQ